MSLSPFYYGLYVHICRKDGVPVGSGFCFDGERILTCAHVVNVSLGKKINSLAEPSEELQVFFPQNDEFLEKFGNTNLNVIVEAWGWGQPAIINADPARYDYTALLMKNDFAVLRIKDASQIKPQLQELCKNVRLLKGSLAGHRFDALTFNPDNPSVINHVNGKFGIDDRRTGTTIMNPGDNLRNFFFDFGSSGSPIISTITFNDGTSVTGIAGYADFLNKKGEGVAEDARMISGSTIEKMFQQYIPKCRWRVVDLDLKKSQLKKIELSQKIITERGKTGKEILCDRMEQLEAVKARKQDLARHTSIYLLCGNERQKLDAFIDRYRYEFIAGSGFNSQLVFFKMPKEREKSLFLISFLGNLYRSLNIPSYESLNPEQMTICIMKEKLGLSDEFQYVFDCRIENDEFDPIQLSFFKWVLEAFLRPLIEGDESVQNIHFFFSYYFKPNEDCNANQELIRQTFSNYVIPYLGNVQRHILEDWLDFVEGRDVERKNKIIAFYPLKTDYDMSEIIELYKTAMYELDKF